MKIQSKISILFLFTTIALLPGAFGSEGSSARGGADLEMCSKGHEGPPYAYVLLADLIDVQHAFTPNFFDNLTPTEMRAGILRYLNRVDSKNARLVATRLKQLRFNFTSSSVPLVNTDVSIPAFLLANEALTSADFPLTLESSNDVSETIQLSELENLGIFCEKAQLATQDFKTGIVDINRPKYDMISVLEEVLLEIHEAYLRIGNERQMNVSAAEDFARKNTSAIWKDFIGLKSALMSKSVLGDSHADELMIKCESQTGYGNVTYIGEAATKKSMNQCIAWGLKDSGYLHCPLDYSKVIFASTVDENALSAALQNCSD